MCPATLIGVRGRVSIPVKEAASCAKFSLVLSKPNSKPLIRLQNSDLSLAEILQIRRVRLS